jgi:hypothetical protein
MISILVRADFEVIQARSADEAWATLEARDDVDVLLADIDIPSPVGGVDLGRYIHGRWPGLGLVLTSDQVRLFDRTRFPATDVFCLIQFRQIHCWMRFDWLCAAIERTILEAPSLLLVAAATCESAPVPDDFGPRLDSLYTDLGPDGVIKAALAVW